MTDPEIKNLLARALMTGLANSSEAYEALKSANLELSHCAIMDEGARNALGCTVLIRTRRPDGRSRAFMFMVREVPCWPDPY